MARVPSDFDFDDDRPDPPPRGRAAADFPDADPVDLDDPPARFGGRPVRVPLAIVLLAAIAGVFLAATSTADFAAHLDRQVHAVTCSVVPGAEAGHDNGCKVVMMSPYSSFWRDSYWGGVPISLWAMAVFAFLAYRAAHLLWRGEPTRAETGFLLAATALPVLMSLIYGYIAATDVGALCTVCAGIYVASGAGFLAAIAAFALSESPPHGDPAAVRRFGVGVLEGTGFVIALTLAWLAFIPETKAGERGVSGCGALVQPEDPAGVMIDLARAPGGVESIELLDPLCPACRAFDERPEHSGLAPRLDLKAVLFPLDSKCNWMVSDSLHPGACAVSEAMLCASGQAEARKILDWAFANQEALLAEAKADEAKFINRLKAQFPAVASCVGTPVARNKVVKSLRWAVANALPVMTPQLFVRGTRLCDEDTDLGLEYTLTRMLSGDKR
ncbi:MAG: vitamin K epoxide reductase family protein [bacterium]